VPGTAPRRQPLAGAETEGCVVGCGMGGETAVSLSISTVPVCGVITGVGGPLSPAGAGNSPTEAGIMGVGYTTSAGRQAVRKPVAAKNSKLITRQTAVRRRFSANPPGSALRLDKNCILIKINIIRYT